MIPSWLHVLSIASLSLGALCAAAIALDLIRRQDLRYLDYRLPLRLRFWDIFPVLHDRSHEESLPWAGDFRCYKGRYLVADGLADRDVWLYGFMAFAYFFIFRNLIGMELRTNSVESWFMMQIAMLFGFATSFPVNWWLIKSGIKEKM